MSFEYLELGSSPSEEDCAQLGSSDYAYRAIAECKAYRNYLVRLFPVPDSLQWDVTYILRPYPYEQESYYEVVIRYNPNNVEAVKFAFQVERKAPAHWDERSIAELRSAGITA